jgi:prevent-host-death family protein
LDRSLPGNRRFDVKTEIGAYDAKTRLPELLRQVRAGRRFTITNRGKPIADLVPAESTRCVDAGAAIERFRTFMRDNPVKTGQGLSIRALIDEGRE